MSRTLKAIILIAVCSLLPPLAFLILWRQQGSEWLMTGLITFGVISYNFVYRIAVGELVSLLSRHRTFNYSSWWFRERGFEKGLYKALNIRKYKRAALTAKPEQFDLKCSTLPEVIQHTCCAELVHEICMLLAYAPVLLIPSQGAPAAFIVTSILSSLLDLYFVLIQRFNRPRLVRLQLRLSQRLAG